MGTHPIFESDFDCLTEMSYEKPPPPYTQNPPMAGFAQPPQGQVPLQPMGQPLVTGQPTGHPLPGGPPVVQVVHTQPVPFGRHPVPTVCCHCNQAVTTEVTYENGLMTWLACGGLVLIGCGLGCCFIPFCVNDMKDAVHTCPKCKRVIATKAL